METKPVHTHLSNETEEENFSFRVLIKEWLQSLSFALNFWRQIGVVAVAGGLLALGYTLIKKPTYTAKLTFVVEEAKSGSGSMVSALAGQLGFDFGGLSGGGGILSGDNVLQLLKSQTFLKQTLLTPYGNSTAKISLADQYAMVYGLKEDWAKSSKVGRVVNFPVGQEKFSRMEDSLLHYIIKRISDKELNISKPDKKLGFFSLFVTNRDELFSKLFCERLLKIATDFYVDTKTKRLSNNVARLQRRADSLGGLLDRRTYSSIDAERLLLDANPAYTSPMANAEISSRNKLLQATVYGEVIKNLEISRTALVQETPTVQIVDMPEMPLEKNKISKLIALLVGMAAGGAIAVLFFAVIKPRKN
jgi:hypothetical protein